MGLNAQTSVPAFTTGQVLTAQQQTDINTGIPVFATSVERDAAFGGTGEKALAEGQYAFLESTNQTLVYDGSSWLVVGASGLTLVKAQTIGSAVGSVTVTDAFSATYDNYAVIITGGAASTDALIGLQLGATTTGYYAGGIVVTYSNNAATNVSNNNTASFTRAGTSNTNSISFNITLQNPFLAKVTHMSGLPILADPLGNAGTFNGFVNNTTSYTAFTLTPSSGTLTGGTIRVYGYANS